MTGAVSPMWRSVPSGIAKRLDTRIDAGIAGAEKMPTVFFRADDIAVPSRSFQRLADLFLRNAQPLNLAVVPAWLTEARWRRLQRIGGRAPELWCWHQHGWRHVNHEPSGKKQEFGDARPAERLRLEIRRGRARLEALLEDDFAPVFTPPWNRCSAGALRALNDLSFRAVSRTAGSRPVAPAPLQEIPVHVDLHTMKTADAAAGWQRLWTDLHAGLSGGRCGIMIHHRRMNDAAFEFLDGLLAALSRREVPVLRFDQMEAIAA